MSQSRSYAEQLRAQAAASRNTMTRLSESGEAIGTADGYVLLTCDDALAVAALLDAAKRFLAAPTDNARGEWARASDDLHIALDALKGK